MNKPKKENVTLKSMKNAEPGKLNKTVWDYHSTSGEGDNEVVHNNKITLESTERYHSDLTDRLKELVPMLSHVWGEKFKGEELSEVSGISLSGTEETRGVIITGKRKAKGGKMAQNSHRINFSGTTYGFEKELEKICDEIADEVYEYYYENKVGEAGVTLFTVDEKPKTGKKKAA